MITSYHTVVSRVLIIREVPCTGFVPFVSPFPNVDKFDNNNNNNNNVVTLGGMYCSYHKVYCPLMYGFIVILQQLIYIKLSTTKVELEVEIKVLQSVSIHICTVCPVIDIII